MLKTKKKIAFIDLLRPRNPIPWDIQFEIYRWMFDTAISSQNYVTYGSGFDSLALLVGNPTCFNIHDMLYGEFGRIGQRRTWKEELVWRWHKVLLEDCIRPGAEQWKKDFRIDINSTRILPIRYHDEFSKTYFQRYRELTGESFLSQCITSQLFNVFGRITKQSHNSSHPKATTIQRSQISITTHPEGRIGVYKYELAYGYLNDSSSWYLGLIGKPNECFADFKLRALEWLYDVTECPAEKVTA